MSWRWAGRLALGAGLAAASVGAPPASAQGVRELEVRVLGVASDPAFGGAGAGYVWRDARRTRIVGGAAVGVLGGHGVAGRADLAWHFLLDPRKRRGSAVYGGGGISLEAGAGRVRPFILLVLGAENAPGGTGGSFVEIGVGGGVRAAVGYRWRKHGAPGR